MHVNEQKLAKNGLTLEDLVPAPLSNDTKLTLKSTKKTFEMFKECRKYNLPGDLSFKPQILTIKENEDKFKKATKESIEQSEELTEYAVEMVQFAEFCKEPDNTAYDLLEGARSILNQAESNKQKTSEILGEYLAIAEGLKKVRDEIENLIEEKSLIENKEKECSNEKNKLKEATSKKRDSMLIEATAVAGGIVGVALAVAIPVAGLVVLIEKIAALGAAGAVAVVGGSATAEAVGVVGAVAGATSTACAVGAGMAGAIKGSSAAVAVQNEHVEEYGKQIKLSEEKIKELEKEIATVDKLKENLNQIIILVSDFETFWGCQVANLKRLVSKIDVREQPTVKPLSEFNALCVIRKWKEVEEKNRSYTKALRMITIEY